MTDDIEDLRNQYNKDKTDWNFSRLCAKMNLGDAIWYVEKHELFNIECLSNGSEVIKAYGKWSDGYISGYQPSIRCGAETPKILKPTKLILVGKFSSEGSCRNTYVFTEPGGDYFCCKKYIWISSKKWHDIEHVDIGLYENRAISMEDVVDNFTSKRVEHIRLQERNNQFVFLDEDACMDMCKKMNSVYFNKMELKEIAKTLRSMQRQLKANIEKYTEL